MQEVMLLVDRAMEGYVSDAPDEDRKSFAIAAGMLVGARMHHMALDDVFIERAAEAVHEAWLSRNGHQASEAERRPYAELSETDKEKDRRYVIRVMSFAD